MKSLLLKTQFRSLMTVLIFLNTLLCRASLVIVERDGIEYTSVYDQNGHAIPGLLSVLCPVDSGRSHYVIPEKVNMDESGKNEWTVVQVHSESFKGNKNIVSIHLPATITVIGTQAFNGCENLSDISLKEGLKEISYGAFANCISLENVVIPNSVTNIGTYGFANSGIRQLTMPISIADNGLNHSAFKDCKKLESVVISSSSKLTTLAGSTFRNCTKLSFVSLSDNITIIESEAFMYCSSLKSIELPKKLTAIWPAVFQGCTSMTSINIPSTVTEIGNWAFAGCTNLASVTFSDESNDMGETGITIGERAFANCSLITSFSIPSQVTEIGYGAFNGCNRLDTIESKAVVPPLIQADTFDDYNKRLYVPADAMINYANAQYWSKFSFRRISNAKPINPEVLQSGLYYITTDRDEYGKYLTVSSSVLGRTNNYSNSATCWHVVSLGDNKYNIWNNQTGEYLMSANCSETSIEPVDLYLFSGQKAFGICLKNDADSDLFLNAYTYNEYVTSWSYDAGSSWNFIKYDGLSANMIDNKMSNDYVNNKENVVVYDLVGRKISKLKDKGLYILNRKKVLIK